MLKSWESNPPPGCFPSFLGQLTLLCNLVIIHVVNNNYSRRDIYYARWLTPSLQDASRDQAVIILTGARQAGKSTLLLNTGESVDPVNIIMRGLMPPLLTLNTHQSWVRWWEGYLATYLERDLRQVVQIDALLDFRKLMELVALRSGQRMNQSAVARDAQLSQPTVHRYLNLLETTNLFDRLPAHAVSHATRLLKFPRVFLNDPGLATISMTCVRPENTAPALRL